MSHARHGIDFVGHRILPNAFDAESTEPINNIVIKNAPKEEHRWLEEASLKIGEWRGILRSMYMRWALAINGLEVAAHEYAKWEPHRRFTVTSHDPSGELIPLAIWDGRTASENHLKTMPSLAEFGLIDMYSGIEEFVFLLYRTYLTQHPDHLLEGPDYRDLRKIRSAANQGADAQKAWNKALKDRLENWQRKHLYDGLERVFKAFCSHSGLKTPSHYTRSTVETWAESIGGIALVRNALVHGTKSVSAELAEFCRKPHRLAFEFKEGDPLDINLIHLQGVECFCEQLLSALNFSMLELAYDKKFKDLKQQE